MRYLFFLLTLLPTLLSAQSTNKNVKFFCDYLILRHNTTGKSTYPSGHGLTKKQLIAALGGNPIVKWRQDQMAPIKDIIYEKDTLIYDWDYNAHDDGFHEIGFGGFALHTPNFSIGDDRNNTFITVGDNAEVFKKWFPKFKITQNFRYLEFTLIGVKDTKTGKWFSEGYLGIGFKQNKNKEWIIANISTEVFEDGTHLVD